MTAVADQPRALVHHRVLRAEHVERRVAVAVGHRFLQRDDVGTQPAKLRSQRLTSGRPLPVPGEQVHRCGPYRALLITASILPRVVVPSPQVPAAAVDDLS